MTVIKNIKEGFLIVSFFVIGIVCHSFMLESQIGKIFVSLPGHNFRELKWPIVTMTFALIGTYWYFIKSYWIQFRSLNILSLLLLFSSILVFCSLYLYNVNQAVENLIITSYQQLPFPTEVDAVKKNIKLSIVEYTTYTLSAEVIIGILAFLAGSIQWFILKKQKRNIAKNV